jgi:hypothetical protein
MTRSIWARVFVASLIFLGDWAFAAENRLRVEIEAVANDIAAQVSKQTILDDADSSIEPAITGVDTTPPVIFTINQKFASATYTVHGKLKYLPLHPRAPPQTAVR